MAKKCCACGYNLGLFDSYWDININYPNYILCENCYTKYKKLASCSESEYLKNIAVFSPLLNSPSTPIAIKEKFPLSPKQTSEKRISEHIQLEQVKSNLTSMILTTGSHFEGYRIVKYIDVIHEEIVFKNSFMNRIAASLEDLGKTFAFNESELTSTSELFSRARNHVKAKFQNKAARLGANAIVGVDFESSIGTEIVRVAIFGTAVIIEPIE